MEHSTGSLEVMPLLIWPLQHERLVVCKPKLFSGILTYLSANTAASPHTMTTGISKVEILARTKRVATSPVIHSIFINSETLFS